PRIVSLDGHADIPLDRGVVVVGRHRRCDVRIASPLVSRRHCCLAVDHEGILVRDLGSTHSTRINGQRIEEGGLHPGDELAMADCRYRIELGLTEGAVPGPSTPSHQGVERAPTDLDFWPRPATPPPGPGRSPPASLTVFPSPDPRDEA